MLLHCCCFAFAPARGRCGGATALARPRTGCPAAAWHAPPATAREGHSNNERNERRRGDEEGQHNQQQQKGKSSNY
eukprot:8076932-Pyramimonas_sp.AAC.1